MIINKQKIFNKKTGELIENNEKEAIRQFNDNQEIKSTLIYIPKPKKQKTTAGQTFKSFYEWEYRCPETGEIKKDKKNVTEEINSSRQQADFKQRVESLQNAEHKGDGNEITDIRAYDGMDASDFHKLSNKLANYSKEEIAEIFARYYENGKSKREDNENTNEKRKEDTETGKAEEDKGDGINGI